MSKANPLFKLIAQPVVIVFIVSLLLMFVSLFLTQRIRPYNSDDVTWQTILYTWRPSSGEKITLGSSDNFVSKIPFFSLFEDHFPSGRKLLFLEASILALFGFTLFYIASVYFLVKAKIRLTYVNLLPFVWLASFGYAFAQLYLNPIWRGFELGLSFAIFMLVAMVYYGDIKPLKSRLAKLLTFIITILFGVLIYSDPYFLYFTFGPIAAFSLALFLLKKITRSQLLITYACIILSLIFAKIVALVSEKIGVRMVIGYPIEFISFDKFFANIALALHGVLVIFGADFFGRKVADIITIGALINASLVALIFAQMFRWRRFADKINNRTISQSSLWTMFFGALSLFAFVLYAISTVGVEAIQTYRYFIMLVLASILLLSLMLGSLRQGRALMASMLLLALVFNIGTAYSSNQRFLQRGTAENTNIGQPGSANNKANVRNFELIQALKSRGLKKGYGNYWQGAINTYLSHGQIQFLPVICVVNHTQPFHWLIDQSQFSIPAEKTFYIIDPDLTQPETCPHEQLIRQFGEPPEFFKIDNKTILIYDYDLSTKM